MDQQRQLVAILFTDIVGYTAMMQKDEQLAVAVIREYHDALEKSVILHHGQIVNNYGDGSLCTFPSAKEAVGCAIQIQQQLSIASVRVPLRIGLHIGEIFFENDKILGDGVNIASRIQSLGEGNSILFSKEIYDKVKNQSGFKAQSLGNFEFKNVDEPVEVFALDHPGLVVPQRQTLSGKLKSNGAVSSRKTIYISAAVLVFLALGFFLYRIVQPAAHFTGKEKSIAVLPFDNMSSDKDNEYFTDGMTEEITTQLSKIADLKVIARSSAMLYRNSKKSVKEIAGELGVSAILEGSVRKTENKIRITAQLIDANTQQHIWADKYDRDFKDIFAIQSEVAGAIARQLDAKLTDEEKQKIGKATTGNAEAYRYYLQGRQLHINFWETKKPESYTKSKAMLEKALELDPGYALAHAALADLYNSFSKTDSQIIALQIAEIDRAWKIDSSDDYVNFVRGTIEQDPLGNKAKAFYYFKRAIQINPNNADNLWGMAMMLAVDFGMYDESRLLFERSIALDPLTANNYVLYAVTNAAMGDWDISIKYLEKALKMEPDFAGAPDILARLYVMKGEKEKALEWINKSFQSHPALEEHWTDNLGYAYAKLGFKKKALEINPGSWIVLLACGMKDEAIKKMPTYDKNQVTAATPYLLMMNFMMKSDRDLVKDDPVFQRIFEQWRKQYEENKRNFSIVGLVGVGKPR